MKENERCYNTSRMQTSLSTTTIWPLTSPIHKPEECEETDEKEEDVEDEDDSKTARRTDGVSLTVKPVDFRYRLLRSEMFCRCSDECVLRAEEDAESEEETEGELDVDAEEKEEQETLLDDRFTPNTGGRISCAYLSSEPVNWSILSTISSQDGRRAGSDFQQSTKATKMNNKKHRPNSHGKRQRETKTNIEINKSIGVLL